MPYCDIWQRKYIAYRVYNPTQQHIMYVVIDTETTGLPRKEPGTNSFYEPCHTGAYDRARIVQIAWLVMDKEFVVKETKNFIIDPSDFEITNSHFHGITQERARRDGVPIHEAFVALNDTINKYNAKFIVGHNLDFDECIILSEIYRYIRKRERSDVSLTTRDSNVLDQVHALKTQLEISLIKICTMKTARHLFPNSKYPKLAELYEYLTEGEEITNPHDAMSDVQHCAACFVTLAVKHQRLIQVRLP